MNRMLILAVGSVLVLLALWRPARAPSSPALAVESAAPVYLRPSARYRDVRRPRSDARLAVVYVTGAVLHPGLYSLSPQARVNDAVQRAGGLRAGADPEAVNLAEHVADGEEIRVTRIGEPTPRPQRKRASRRTRALPLENVDINTADASTLASLPGIGATLAARIVEYRQLNGPFASFDELADVAGMTQRHIDEITPYATLHDAPR
jgi:competence protein ComEA